jgi:hypothetical protein
LLYIPRVVSSDDHQQQAPAPDAAQATELAPLTHEDVLTALTLRSFSSPSPLLAAAPPLLAAATPLLAAAAAAERAPLLRRFERAVLEAERAAITIETSADGFWV